MNVKHFSKWLQVSTETVLTLITRNFEPRCKEKIVRLRFFYKLSLISSLSVRRRRRRRRRRHRRPNPENPKHPSPKQLQLVDVEIVVVVVVVVSLVVNVVDVDISRLVSGEFESVFFCQLTCSDFLTSSSKPKKKKFLGTEKKVSPTFFHAKNLFRLRS